MASKVIRMTFFFPEAKVEDKAKRMKMKTRMKSLNLWKLGNFGSVGFASMFHGLLCKYPPKGSGPCNDSPLMGREWHNYLEFWDQYNGQFGRISRVPVSDIARDNHRSPERWGPKGPPQGFLPDRKHAWRSYQE
jgi:hypothetical protein